MPINRLSVVIIAQFSSRERNIKRINDGSKDAEINLSPKMVKICRNTIYCDKSSLFLSQYFEIVAI